MVRIERSILKHRAAQRVLALMLLVLCQVACAATLLFAQGPIVRVRPDEVAPGMTIALEVLARADSVGAFGVDGLEPDGTAFVLNDLRDTTRIVSGPVIVSWNGRVAQVPILVMPTAFGGPIRFRIVSKDRRSNLDSFTIVQPQHLPLLTGNVTIGEAGAGRLSLSNTLVVDSFIASGAQIGFSLRDPDPGHGGNLRLQPVTILSQGRVSLQNSRLYVDAQGLNGGPGGGGGGHGHEGIGGYGFTGGGNSALPPDSNIGSGGDATTFYGGASVTGVPGGASEYSDQGGGGGTGAPYGSSGAAGIGAAASRSGGVGGGSGGGEAPSESQSYGGGGGGFGTDGLQGGGIGNNGGLTNGGRFLVPLAGGSGGGAGNALNDTVGAGSGGGGGGSVALIGYGTFDASSTTISASGDSGTSSIARLAAGGGGGSGGAIYIAAKAGLNATSLATLAIPGRHGEGGALGAPGGDGGYGRYRLDAEESCAQCQQSAVSYRGITVQPIGYQRAPFVKLTGVAGDLASGDDTVRVYYRTRHMRWQHVDTVRVDTGFETRWSKWLPLFHDSLVFVVAMLKVRGPSTDTANMEPEWLVSHVSQSIIRHTPSPFLVIADTLNVGSVRVGHCGSRYLYLSNQGDSVLRIDSLAQKPPYFIYSHSLPWIIPPYATDSLLVTFCPDSALLRSSVLRIYATDSPAVHTIALSGFGTLRRDSIVIVPSFVDLGRVRVGDCDTASITIYSRGVDTAILNFKNFAAPPFSLQVIAGDSAIPPGASATLRVVFCPADTLSYYQRVILNERQDTLLLAGRGTIRRLTTLKTIELGEQCGRVVQFADTISNVGNDTLKVLRLSGTQESTAIGTFTVLPGARYAIVWNALPSNAGEYSDTLRYETDESSVSTIVHFVLHRPRASFDSSTRDFTTCLGTCDSVTISVRNTGTESVALSRKLSRGAVFSIGAGATTLSPGDSARFSVTYCPSVVGEDEDTAQFQVSVGSCDSMFTLALRGQGTASKLLVSSIDYDTVRVGDCRDDSLEISNVCGPADTVVIPRLPGSYTLLESSDSIVLRSGETRAVLVRFCPKIAGVADTSVVAESTRGQSLVLALRGVGIERDTVLPHGHLSMSSATILLDSIGSTVITLDSSSITGVHYVSDTLRYDPSVVEPIGVIPGTGVQLRPGEYLIEDTRDLTDVGVFAVVSWRGLLGASAETMVSISAYDSAATLSTTSGAISVIDCAGLTGRINVAGTYTLDQIRPNPTSSDFTIGLNAGAAGRLVADIYDLTGRLERRVVDRDVAAGSQTFRVEIAGLASGEHLLVLRSLGWVEARPLLIQK